MLVSREFRQVQSHSQKKTGSFCTIYLHYHSKRQNGSESARLGITVPLKYGKAHERNRFKRIARDAFRLYQHRIPVGIDLIIRPLPSAHTIHTQDLIKEFEIILPSIS